MYIICIFQSFRILAHSVDNFNQWKRSIWHPYFGIYLTCVLLERCMHGYVYVRSIYPYIFFLNWMLIFYSIKLIYKICMIKKLYKRVVNMHILIFGTYTYFLYLHSHYTLYYSLNIHFITYTINICTILQLKVFGFNVIVKPFNVQF